MSTVFANAQTVRRDWYVVDATGKTLGRLASQVATRLRGKHKAAYTPNCDTGDHIVIVNAGKIRVTGRKLTDKFYHHHTGYMGNLKSTSLEAARQAPGACHRVRGQGHAPEEHARSQDVQEAARVRERGSPAQRAAAEGAGNLIR